MPEEWKWTETVIAIPFGESQEEKNLDQFKKQQPWTFSQLTPLEQFTFECLLEFTI